MDVARAIREKQAIRSFLPRPIPDPVARQILLAGRRAQSAKNSQPWHFIAVREKSKLERLSQTGKFASHLAGAALGVVIATPDPSQKFTIAFDAGQAAAYMQLAAWELGVGSCLASLYDPEAARRILGIPVEWHPRIGVSFGYFDLQSQPPSGVQHPGRKAFDEIVHWEKW
ncbi:MAG: nitroreductase family protein [Anaerolineales bacterium]|nr:nitroreductase family protein [Anaerolineales bacterium]